MRSIQEYLNDVPVHKAAGRDWLAVKHADLEAWQEEVERLRVTRHRLFKQIAQLCEWPAELPLLTEEELNLVKATEATMADECQHGSLRRKCELCYRDGVIIDLGVEIGLLQARLRRVRDVIKFAANSEGGLVDEIDRVLAATRLTTDDPPCQER